MRKSSCITKHLFYSSKLSSWLLTGLFLFWLLAKDFNALLQWPLLRFLVIKYGFSQNEWWRREKMRERDKIQRQRKNFCFSSFYWKKLCFVVNSYNMWYYIFKLDYKAIFNIRCLQWIAMKLTQMNLTQMNIGLLFVYFCINF